MTEFTSEWIAICREEAKVLDDDGYKAFTLALDHIEQQAKRIEELEIHNKNLHLACVNALDLHRESDVPKLKDIPKIIEELRTRVQELEQERRWIPVSERLPEVKEDDSIPVDFIVKYVHKSIVSTGTFIDSEFYELDNWDKSETENVTHWKYRPQPPESEEE